MIDDGMMVFIVINPEALSGSTDGSVKLWCLKDTTFRCSGISNCSVTASCWVDWVAMADGRWPLFFWGAIWEELGNTMATLWPYYMTILMEVMRCSKLEATCWGGFSCCGLAWEEARRIDMFCQGTSFNSCRSCRSCLQLWEVLHWFAQRSGALLGLSISGSESKGIHGIHMDSRDQKSWRFRKKGDI